MKQASLAAGATTLGLSGREARSEPARVSSSDGERPNILWVTAEDTSPNLGCYGDPNAVTPSLDQFASQGVRFTNVFSVHPCCSSSRSCLVTGIYSTRLGTFQHRGKVWIPARAVRCFPALLREAGYYCFNGSRGGGAKLDYNFEPKDKPWDKVGSKEIEWRNRPAGRPFFGQINLACTHQSQYGKREPGAQPKGQQAIVHDPAKVHVPPYHPNTAAVREIWAEYHDRITQMDQQFVALLKQLEDDGLANNTIVFFFGDNGHGIPGGKVWLWEGPHVPLIIRFPKRWEHLAPSPPGATSDRLVSFLDFAPTMLSLAGVAIPDHIQGVAFAGPKAGEPRQYAFAARDFHDGADFDTTRMARNQRYHYLRNFMPHIGWDAIQYSWQHAPYMLEEWRQQAEAGRLKANTRQACFFRRTKPVEELYDVEKDPFLMHNLAGDPQHRAVLERMRAACEK
ncbi:sulfatase, partial [Candidatus Sumerlaeota bacterium]|nr:sulfatase [Candidatus Sumerlaeota bacterium]